MFNSYKVTFLVWLYVFLFCGGSIYNFWYGCEKLTVQIIFSQFI